jgi:hypothetical protein
VEETINIEVIERLRDILALFDLYGFYIWITIYKRERFSPGDSEEILRTINKLTPYFEDITLFQEKKGKIRLPPGIEERKKNSENFYLTNILKKSVEEDKEIKIEK